MNRPSWQDATNAALIVAIATFLGPAIWAKVIGPAPNSAPVVFSGPSMERDSIVASAARKAGMPPALAIAVSHVENWAGDSTARHPISGALGLMQVLPRAWGDSFIVECGPEALVNRWRNACVGAHVAFGYFVDCGNWDCALRRYVGATCTKTDTWYRCQQKQKAGDAYVLAVMQRLYRTDLSPARDQMALGTSWRRDVTMK